MQFSATSCHKKSSNSNKNTLRFVVPMWQNVEKLKKYEKFCKALGITLSLNRCWHKFTNHNKKNQQSGFKSIKYPWYQREEVGIYCEFQSPKEQGWPVGMDHWLLPHRDPENTLKSPGLSWSELDLGLPGEHTTHPPLRRAHYRRTIGSGRRLPSWSAPAFLGCAHTVQ